MQSAILLAEKLASDCVKGCLPRSICKCRVTARVALRVIFKANARLRNDFRGGKRTVHEVVYLEESDMPSLDMRVSTVLYKLILKL